MTLADTNNLKKEIKRMIDLIGFNFMNTSWLGNLSDSAKNTLSEYVYDARTLGRREVAMMLYNDQDSELWHIIMS